MEQKDFQEYVIEQFEKLDRRLFKDNGNLSMQSKINQNTGSIKLMLKIFSAVSTIFLGLFLFLLTKQFGG